MERIINQKHNSDTFLFAMSRVFERMGYYGLRSVTLLYIMGETFEKSREDALLIYGSMATVIFFSQILGGFLGDLVIGNKKSIIIGGLMQAIGAFILCIPNIYVLYAGLALVALGGGLYKPNFIAQFGKLYLNKTKLLDSGFLILRLLVNIGTFLAALLLVRLAQISNYSTVFVIIGFFFILSIIYPYFSKENIEKKQFMSNISFNSRIILISITIIFVGLFWIIYDMSNYKLTAYSLEFKNLFDYDFLKNLESVWFILPLIPISIIFIFIWTYYYYSQFTKLIIGFVLAIVSFAILSFIPNVSVDNQLLLYLLAIIILGISEIHITPIVYATLTKYINPKYLATAIGLSTIPVKLLFWLLVLFKIDIFNETYPIKYLLFVMIIALLILVGLVFVFRKNFIQIDNFKEHL